MGENRQTVLVRFDADHICIGVAFGQAQRGRPRAKANVDDQWTRPTEGPVEIDRIV